MYYSYKTPFVCTLLIWAYFFFILNDQVAEEVRIAYQVWATAICFFVVLGVFHYEVIDRNRFHQKKEAVRSLSQLGKDEIEESFKKQFGNMWNSPRFGISILCLLWAFFAIRVPDFHDATFIGVTVLVLLIALLSVYNRLKVRN